MVNIVKGKYVYEDVLYNATPKTIEAFECLLEHIKVEGKRWEYKVNNYYTSYSLCWHIGTTIPSSVLSALVRRGMIVCGEKKEGRNTYMISDEIYDYYNEVYLPTKKKYQKEMKAFSRKWHRTTPQNNEQLSEKQEEQTHEIE